MSTSIRVGAEIPLTSGTPPQHAMLSLVAPPELAAPRIMADEEADVPKRTGSRGPDPTARREEVIRQVRRLQNVSAVAAALGMTRQAVYDHLRRARIDLADLRRPECHYCHKPLSRRSPSLTGWNACTDPACKAQHVRDIRALQAKANAKRSRTSRTRKAPPAD